MPSNKELKESIVAITVEAGVDTPVLSGKSNDELTIMLQKLTTPAPPEPEVEAPPEPEVEAPPEPEVEAFPYSIAPGKSVTCKKGVLADGDEMKVEFIHGGQDSLDKLIKRKYVIKA